MAACFDYADFFKFINLFRLTGTVFLILVALTSVFHREKIKTTKQTFAELAARLEDKFVLLAIWLKKNSLHFKLFGNKTVHVNSTIFNLCKLIFKLRSITFSHLFSVRQ